MKIKFLLAKDLKGKILKSYGNSLEVR